MRVRTILAATLAITVWNACDQGSRGPAPAAGFPSRPASRADGAGEIRGGAAWTPGPAERREAFEARVRRRLESLGAVLAGLPERVQGKRGGRALDHQIRNLETRREKLQARLPDLAGAPEAQWREASSRTEAEVDSLERAIARLQDKM